MVKAVPALRRPATLGVAVFIFLALAASSAGCGAIPGLTRPTATSTPTSTSTPTATPSPTPTLTPTPTAPPLVVSLTLEPATVPQGGIATLMVVSSRPATITATLSREPLPLYQEGGRWYGLVGIYAAAEPASLSLVVTADDPLGGKQVVARRELRVSARQFEVEEVQLSQSTLGLILDTDAVEKEAALVTRAVGPRTASRLWRGAFRRPIEGIVTSTYGMRRSYNGGPPGEYHGGLDLAADEGTPVGAANAGRVVFAGRLSVRGNTVIIDHGWGLYTGYYHMSAIHVTAGQDVEQGQTLGLVGSTGLSTGPHLHWAVWLGGIQVDPTALLEWQLPH